MEEELQPSAGYGSAAHRPPCQPGTLRAAATCHTPGLGVPIVCPPGLPSCARRRSGGSAWCRLAGLGKGVVSRLDPAPSGCFPLRGFGSSLLWGGRERGGGGGEGGRRCRKSLLAKIHHQTAPEVLPCTAAASHYGGTLWTRAGVYVHTLTRACPLFFLNLSTAEQLKQTALQQAAPQSMAFQ